MADALQIANTINRALQAHTALDQAIGDKGSGPGEPITGTREAQVPINLDIMDQREFLADQIIGWASITEEETGQRCSRLNAPTAGRWMVEQSQWIAGAPWALDMIQELRSTTKRSEAMLGQLPKRTPIDIPCECGQPQAIIHETKMYVRCSQGHETTLADHGALPDGEPLTVTQVARLLDMARSTIGNMIDRGIIAAEGSPPKIPRHELTKLRDRLAS